MTSQQAPDEKSWEDLWHALGMGDLPQTRVTQLLLAWREGDSEALEQLTPMVYDELRRLARHYLRDERSNRSLQTTELVHEAYLRLVGADVSWEGRSHFFAIAANTMRRILVDMARRRRADKRAGSSQELPLLEIDLPTQDRPDLVALDDALKDLARVDERKSQIVELRFFGGLTIAETAEVIGLSHATVERDFKLARAWLNRQVGVGDA